MSSQRFSLPIQKRALSSHVEDSGLGSGSWTDRFDEEGIQHIPLVQTRPSLQGGEQAKLVFILK